MKEVYGRTDAPMLHFVTNFVSEYSSTTGSCGALEVLNFLANNVDKVRRHTPSPRTHGYCALARSHAPRTTHMHTHTRTYTPHTHTHATTHATPHTTHIHLHTTTVSSCNSLNSLHTVPSKSNTTHPKMFCSGATTLQASC